MAKEAKFVCTDEGEFGLVIMYNGDLMIMDVEKNEEQVYSKELVEELINFLENHWDE